MAGKLYRMFRFILATSLIAYLFYVEDILRFYFTPFYFLWYFLPLILKFTSHLEHVGMSPEDYVTVNNDDYSYNQPKTNQNNSAINSYSMFDDKEERDISDYRIDEFIPNPETKEEYRHNEEVFYYFYEQPDYSSTGSGN